MGGHHGTLDITDMVVMDLVSMDARREKLMPSQKENLMLTLGYIIPPMDTGHHGTLDITDMVVTDLAFMDARRETLMPRPKENLMLTLGCITTPTDTGQHGTLDITDMVAMDLVSMDARREKLMLFLMLMPTLKHTTIYMVTGQQDTMVTTVLMDGTTGIVLANNDHV